MNWLLEPVQMSYNKFMNNLTHVNFTQNKHAFQLRMNFDVDTLIPEDSKVRLVCNIVEEMNLEPLLSTQKKKGRKPKDLVSMLKILLFCYSERIVSTRDIEDFCTYDTRAHFILQDVAAPDHSTISRFIQRIDGYATELLTQFVEMLIEEGHVNLDSIYIDGTKIESVAGRYTFVWRKTVEKNQQKLMERMIKELKLPEKTSRQKVIEAVQSEFNRIISDCKRNHVVFVHGRGKRKNQLQRDFEHYHEVLHRFEAYQEHLTILGARNSYSKTDHEATFMRMKDDHMRNGQLKPAYNIQFASNGAFIVGVMGSQKSNDLHTLIPFLEQMKPRYGNHLNKIVADAGYESVENYNYLKEHHLKSYIKPSNYEQSKKKKVRDDIGRKENMEYLPGEDAYLCKNGKKLIRVKDSTKKYVSGYEDTVRTYCCTECSDCPLNNQCIKRRKQFGQATRKYIKFSPAFENYRRESYKNITSDEGIIERMNRSIQAEGMFSKLKNGLQYVRFRHRSMRKVIADITLMAIGININKLHSKKLKNQEGVILYKKIA